MRGPPPPDNVMLLALVLTVAGVLHALWEERAYRRRLALLEAKHTSCFPTIADVRDRLWSINKCSRPYRFTAKWRVNIAFRGMALTIVVGTVAAMDWRATWRASESLFALAEHDQILLLETYPKVFRPVWKGAQDSVYFVNLAKLLRVLNG